MRLHGGRANGRNAAAGAAARACPTRCLRGDGRMPATALDSRSYSVTSHAPAVSRAHGVTTAGSMAVTRRSTRQGHRFGQGANRGTGAARTPHRRRYSGRTGGARHFVAATTRARPRNRRLCALPARTGCAQYARWARLLRALGAPTGRVQRALRVRSACRSAAALQMQDLAQKQPLWVPREVSQTLPGGIGEASPWVRAGARSGLCLGSNPSAAMPQILARSSRWCSAWVEHHQSITSALEQVVLKTR